MLNIVLFRVVIVKCNAAARQVIKKVGRGKYSEVFKGFNARNAEFCIIKVPKP